MHFIWSTFVNVYLFYFIHTREIFPEGLPPSYVFVATLRLKGSSSKLTFDLWRVLSKDKKIQAAVTLSGKDKTVIFTTTSTKKKEQKVVFKAGFQVWWIIQIGFLGPTLKCVIDEERVKIKPGHLYNDHHQHILLRLK